jgi:hypothetical protein
VEDRAVSHPSDAAAMAADMQSRVGALLP